MTDKMKNGALIFAPVVMLLLWVLFIIGQIVSGQTVKVRISGYDPIDYLSGRYISYQINWEETDCTQFEDNECPKELFKKYGKMYGDFYVSERKAQILEEAIADRNNVAEVLFSYRPNKQPYATGLSVNGKVVSGF